MSRHTNWDKWMAENIRYALTHNISGEKSAITFSEYPFYKQSTGGISYIDVVGKNNRFSRLGDSIVVEIKSSISDYRSGRGKNFFGKYNFFATDTVFEDQLSILLKEDANCFRNVGLLVVQPDGRVITKIPSEYNRKHFVINSNFNDYTSDKEVEDFFIYKEIPRQKYDNTLKIYPVEKIDV